jgi:tetratricopeptide (TPR) repeat protein
MFDHLDRKESTNNASSLESKSGNTVFSPLSPFSINNSNKTEYSLPDWILLEEQYIERQVPKIYNFDWLQDKDITHNNSPTIEGTANTSDYPEALLSAHKRQQDNADSTKAQQENNNPNTVNDIPANHESDSDYATNVKDAFVEVGTSTEILTKARKMSRDGNLDESIGNYMSLVKSAKKLKQVVDDLEKLVANPHLKETPAMLQTLADAYTKTGEFAKALPLYRKALGR